MKSITSVTGDAQMSLNFDSFINTYRDAQALIEQASGLDHKVDNLKKELGQVEAALATSRAALAAVEAKYAKLSPEVTRLEIVRDQLRKSLASV